MATRAAMASMVRVALAETPAARIVPRRGMASGGGTFLSSLPFLFFFPPFEIIPRLIIYSFL